jgi:hypothetical protein
LFLSSFFPLSGWALVLSPDEEVIVTLDDLRLCDSLIWRAKATRNSLLGDENPSVVFSPGGHIESRLAFLKSLAWAKGTRMNLKCQLQAYLLFCFYFDFEPFPLEDRVLARFAAFLSFTFKTADAISSYISRVRSVYKLAYLKDPPTSGPEFALTLHEFRRLMQHRVRPVDGLLPEDLSLMASVSESIFPKGKAL